MAEDAQVAMRRRLKAGFEYLDGLRKLAFEPQSLLWAGVRQGAPANSEELQMELLIVTSWVDNIGPKRIYELLFEAYDACATPKEIDPFIVSLFSPKTQVAKDIQNAVYMLETRDLGDDAKPMLVLGMFDYVTIPDWVIYNRPVRTSRFEDARHFAAFERNVERLAA